MKHMSKTTPNSGKHHVVFFGSGPVAAESLRLLQQHCSIEAIVTKPATVHEMSGACPDAPIHSVNNKSELDELMSTMPFQSGLAILIDFGIIVSRQVIDSFKNGIINSHFSLLPEWRGADPITFSILSGQTKTGVSLMLLDEGMDTGKILVQKSLPIEPTDTGPYLTNKLIDLSDKLLQQTIPSYLLGTVKPRSQPHPDRATYSRKLTKEDGVLDFTKPATQLEREVRAFIAWPKSRTTIAGKDVIITQAYAVPSTGVHQKPGDITVVKETGLVAIATSSGSVWIEKLKPAGKKEMTAREFIIGYRL
jgi:methionyl-tRNA formyltransferase